MAFVGIFFISMIVMLFALVLFIIELVGKWQVYKKMGLAPWKCLIPFYSTYCEFGKVWEVKFFIAWMVLQVINWFTPGFFESGVGFGMRLFALLITAALLVLNFLLCFKTAQAFDAGIGFAIGLLILPFIFFPILGFSRMYTYHDPSRVIDA